MTSTVFLKAKNVHLVSADAKYADLIRSCKTTIFVPDQGCGSRSQSWKKKSDSDPTLKNCFPLNAL